MVNIEEAKQRFGAFADMLNFIEEGNYIIMKPKQFLGSDNFVKIATITRQNGGEYISAGKESHFRLPLTASQSQPSKFTPSDPLAVTKHIDDIINRLEALKKEVDEMLKR